LPAPEEGFYGYAPYCSWGCEMRQRELEVQKSEYWDTLELRDWFEDQEEALQREWENLQEILAKCRK